MRDRRTFYIRNATVLDSVVFNHTDDDQQRSDMAFLAAYGEDIGRAFENAIELLLIDSMRSL